MSATSSKFELEKFDGNRIKVWISVQGSTRMDKVFGDLGVLNWVKSWEGPVHVDEEGFFEMEVVLKEEYFNDLLRDLNRIGGRMFCKADYKFLEVEC